MITKGGKVRFTCKRTPWEPKCVRFGQCPLLPVFVDSDLNTPDLAAVYERYLTFPYGSREWKAIYAKRSSVERVNSRLKECRRLERHCFRSLAKVTAHALISVLSMQAAAMAAFSSDGLIRRLNRRIA